MNIDKYDGEEEVMVDFAGCRTWVGAAKDLQKIRNLRIKDEVQVSSLMY